MTCAPPSTSRTVVFPFKEDSGTFSSDSAESYLASYQVSHQEVTQFISQIETEYKLQKESKKKDNQDMLCIFLFSILSIALSSFIFSDFLRDGLSSYDDGILKKGSLAMLILTFYPMKVWMWLWPSWKCETYSFDEMRGKCQEIIDQHNKILRSRGLKWSITSKYLGWIELTKGLHEQNNELEPISEHSKIPPSKETIIIFPAQYFIAPGIFKKSRNYIFSSDFYSSEMTDDRISREEVQDFISDMNADYRKTLKGLKGQMIEKTLVLPAYVFMGLLILSNYAFRHFPDIFGKNQFNYLFFVSEVISGLLVYVRYVREAQKQNIQIRAGCQIIVDKYNQNLKHRGLRWSLPEKFPLWIELCKDYSLGIQLVDMSLNKQDSVFIAEDFEAQRPKNDRKHHKKPQNDMYSRLLDDKN